jgi:predicted CoA-binding protein
MLRAVKIIPQRARHAIIASPEGGIMRTMYDQIDEKITRLVLEAKEIAVLGCSSQPLKPSHFVPRYMQEQGCRIIPITTNQFVDRVLEENVYRDLMGVPDEYDILVVFRPPNEIPVIVNNYFNARHQAPLIWFQAGIYDQESFNRIEEAGLNCVMDRCIMVEHQKMIAGAEPEQ